MPASTADPVSSVLKNAFASNVASRNEIGTTHQSQKGLIRGGNSSSVLGSTTSFDHEQASFGLNGSAKSQSNNLLHSGNSSLSSSPNLENGIRANAKRLLLSSQQCNVEFDEPTRHVGGLVNGQISNNVGGSSTVKSKIIIINPHQKQLQSNGSSTPSKKSNGETNGKTDTVCTPKPKVTFYSLSSVEIGYKNIRKAGSGMFNMGNTCYLNSTLQALFHTPALYNYLTSNAHTSKCTGSLNGNGFIQNCTICALSITLRDTLRNNVIKPNRVYEKLKHICKHMVHGRQEDAHEFLRYLIEACQRSFLISAQAPKSLDNASKETTPFNQIFGGYMRQDVTCLRCKHVSTTVQHFMDLLLDIRQVSNIEEALGQYFRQERIGGNAGDGESNMYKCEKCKIKVQAKKRYLIERPPAVLCIQLKRFSLLGGKISKPVQLHRRINLAPYIQSKIKMPSNGINSSRENLSSPQGAHSVGCEYSLVAMITHVGPSPNCGHYTAIGEAANGQFFQFDDSSVRPISVGQALNTASYVVFYEMTKASWKNLTNNSICKVPGDSNSTDNKPNQSPMTKAKVPCTVTSQTNQAANGNSPTVKPTINMYNRTNGNNTNSENKPCIIPLGSSMKPAANKLGIVSGVAKNALAAAASIVRTVTNAASGGSNATSMNIMKSTNKGGLVPYDEDSSDSESTATAAKEYDKKPSNPNDSSTKRPLTASPFVPRSVTVNALKAKPSAALPAKLETNKETKSLQSTSQTTILQSSNVERKSSSSGVWTVTDADTHNPSVNSDNSTGSTSGNWNVKDIDSNKGVKSATIEEDSMITVQHSKTSSTWTVRSALSPSSLPAANVTRSESMSSSDKDNATPNKKVNTSISDSESNDSYGKVKSGQRITSPSPSTSSSTSSNSSIQYKQKQYSSFSFNSGASADASSKSLGTNGSDQGDVLKHLLGNDTPRKRCNGGNTDEGDTDYDAELDRGRTKKVKKIDVENGPNQLPSTSSSMPNPFQVAQNGHYNKNDGRRSEGNYNKMNNPRSPWQPPRNKSWSNQRDHNYKRQQGSAPNMRNNHREDSRRNSFGANDYKDKKYRNNGFNNESYRGYNGNSNTYNNRDHRDDHRDYKDNRSYLSKY